MEGSSQKPENDELPHGIQEISPPVVPVSKQSVTPLPWGKVFIVCMIQFCDALSVTAVFPYLGQMTADLMGLDYERDANLVGYYAGMIASFYFVAQFLTSPIWGYISDRWGRKYILIFGLFGTAFTCLLFGFSKWFLMAIGARLLYGALNGNLGIIKTYLREITDQTNQARAFGMLGTAYPLGSVVGPMIGGFAANPAILYPAIFGNGFWKTFPYLLPNIILALIAVFGAICGFFFITEIKKVKVKTQEVFGENLCTRLRKGCKTSYLWSRGAIFSLIVYGSLGFIQIIFVEILPLWLWTPITNGGCGFQPYQIGLLNAAIGGVVIATQLIYTPFMNNKIGVKKAQILSNFLTLPIYFIMPELRWLALYDYRVILWISLILCLMWRTSLIESSFTSVIMLVNNAVPKNELGTMNGIAQSCVAGSRAVGPTLGSILFAWSLSGLPFPFDVHFVFYFCGILAIILIPVAMIRPELKPFEEDKELEIVAVPIINDVDVPINETDLGENEVVAVQVMDTENVVILDDETRDNADEKVNLD